jgi:hypothetical protein
LVFSELIIPGNETNSFSLDFLDENFINNFKPGEYKLNAFLLGGYSDTASAGFELVSQE